MVATGRASIESLQSLYSVKSLTDVGCLKFEVNTWGHVEVVWPVLYRQIVMIMYMYKQLTRLQGFSVLVALLAVQVPVIVLQAHTAFIQLLSWPSLHLDCI